MSKKITIGLCAECYTGSNQGSARGVLSDKECFPPRIPFEKIIENLCFVS
jgi:hypothetical protein